MKFQLDIYHRNIPDDELLADLIRVAEEIGKRTVTIDEYNERGRFNNCTLSRRFGSWLVALNRAGLDKTRNLNISNDALFENLVNVWTKLGRQPRYNELTKDHSDYCSGTYEYRFGGWRKALDAFVEWANEGVRPIDTNKKKVDAARKTPRQANWRLRALVLMRDGAQCQLCGATPQDGAKLQVDHIIPWSKGGQTAIENLQILCEKCNIGKSDL